MYGGSTDVFKPPSVHYDPFAKPLVDTHKRTKKPAPEEAAVPRIRSVIPARVPNALHAVLQFQTGGSEGAPAIASVRPPSVDSNLSDWTDCDSDEFDTMQVRGRTCSVQQCSAAGMRCRSMHAPAEAH